MTTPFVVIFEGRNGSSHLASLLNTQADVLCYPKILPQLDLDRQLESASLAAADVRKACLHAGDDHYFIQGFDQKWNMRPFKAFGFKARGKDFKNIVAMMARLEGMNYRLIYLRHENILKAALSLINGQRLADQTNQWNARTPGEIQRPVEVNLQFFKHGLAHRQVVESLHQWFYETFAGEKTAFFYEDMLGNQERVLSQVLEFIGVPAERAPAVGTFFKNTPDSLSGAILNYDEFVQEYKDTNFAKYLD